MVLDYQVNKEMEVTCSEEGIKVEVCDDPSGDATSHDLLIHQISKAKQNTNKAIQIAQQVFLHTSPQRSDVFDSVAGHLVNCIESLELSLQPLQSLKVKLDNNSREEFVEELAGPVKIEHCESKFDLRKCTVKLEPLSTTRETFYKGDAVQEDYNDNDIPDQGEVFDNSNDFQDSDSDPFAEHNSIDPDLEKGWLQTEDDLETEDIKEGIKIKSKIKRTIIVSSNTIKPKIKKNNDIESTFSCDKCVRTYSRKYDLKKHLLKHSDGNSSEEEDISETNEELKCTKMKCSFSCFNPKYMNDHINGELKYRKCPWCQHFIRAGDKEFMIHIKKRHHEKAKHKNPLVCFTCDTKFDRTDRYDLHLSKKHGLGTLFHCPQKNCEYTNTVLVEMRKHLKRKDILTFDCMDCKYKAETELKLQNHIDLHHVRVSCDVCNVEFHSKLSLDLHNIQSHNATPKTKKEMVCCDICGATLDKKKLKGHMREMHDTNKVWSCDICNATAANGRSLRRHKAKVHGEKKYMCEQCPFAATTRDKLMIHVNRHSGKQPGKLSNSKYKKEGRVSNLLANQMETQVEAGTSIPCQYCDFKATDNIHLIQHFSAFHNI